MTLDELQVLIADGESQTIEFKQSFAEENEGIRSLGAFANTDGGTVFFGLADDGSPAALKLGQRTLEEFANKLRRESEPPLPASLESLTVGESVVVVVSVPKALPRQLFYTFNIPRVRIGKTNQVMSPSEQQARLSSQAAKRIDDGTPHSARGVGDILFAIERGDIVKVNADVVALKYAQSFYGTDYLILRLLAETGVDASKINLSTGDYTYLESHGVIAAPKVLYVGVPRLQELRYLHLAEFSRRTLEIVSLKEGFARSVAMTIHGPGFGLDEREALFAQVSGIFQAMRSGRIPSSLERIFHRRD